MAPGERAVRLSTFGQDEAGELYAAHWDWDATRGAVYRVIALAEGREPLAVMRAGRGQGTVTSVPAGIQCGTDCFEAYPTGTSVTLSAVGAPGSAFVEWSGACTGTGPCVLSMDMPRTVWASFRFLKDLMVDGLALSAATVASGRPVSVTYDIRSLGPGTVTEVYTDRIYLSPSATLGPDAMLLGTSHGHTAGLAPGATHAHSQAVTVPAATPPGPYFILVHTDALGLVPEHDESNNVAAIPVTVTLGKDLRVVNALAVPGPLAPGGKVTVSYGVRNQGTLTVTETYAERIHLSGDSTLGPGALALGTTTGHSTDLAAGATAAHSLAVTIPVGTVPGDYYLLIQADALGAVTESDESNNVTAVAVTVAVPRGHGDRPRYRGAGDESSTGGTWSVSTAPSPFGANSLYHDQGNATYRWTPTILAPQAYEVFVWWTVHVNRATEVPYVVEHAGGTIQTTRNQRTGGGAWQSLGTFTFNAGTGAMRQASAAAGQASADAVRFVPVASAPPLPTVTIATTDGEAAEAAPTAGTLTVTRTGDTTGPLTVTYTVGGTATAGSDYEALSGSLVIAAGQATAAIVVLAVQDAAVGGAGDGRGDADATGGVHGGGGECGDGHDRERRRGPAGGGDRARQRGGGHELDGRDMAPVGGAEPLRRELAVPRPGHGDLPLDAHDPDHPAIRGVRVVDGAREPRHGGAVRRGARRRHLPDDPQPTRGRRRVAIAGDVHVQRGDRGFVQVSAAAGQASADAARFVPVGSPAPPGPIVLDNGTAGTSSTGGTWPVSAGPSPFGASSLYHDQGTATYRWTPTIPTTQPYEVLVWWTVHANRGTAVPYVVEHAGGAFQTTRNQQVGGGVWQSLGTFTFNAGTGGFVQVSAAAGQASADAVRFVPAP